MSSVVFLADFFANEIAGGGELNNEELIMIMRKKGVNIIEVKTNKVTPEFISRFPKDVSFIVANFVSLSHESKRKLEKDRQYIIYEHDHKYLKSRNPANYKNFIAPPSKIINFDFYKNAMAVLCQSAFHSSIVRKNLQLENVVNLSGNLWSEKSLDLMEKMALVEKEPTCAIMGSKNWHKNTVDAIRLCEHKKWKYDLIPPSSYMEFLARLGKSEKFIFLPKTPETLSRITVEAKMMGLSVVTNGLVGATKEDWFSLKGAELIEVIRNKRNEIPETVESFLL